MKFEKTIHNAVLETLIESEAARNNDIETIYRSLKKLHLPTDIRELRNLQIGNIFESIRRERQKIQASNPFLAAGKSTKLNRKKKEEEMRMKAHEIF